MTLPASFPHEWKLDINVTNWIGVKLTVTANRGCFAIAVHGHVHF